MGTPVATSDLPASQRFIGSVPEIVIGSMNSVFDFLRLSQRQHNSTSFKIGIDATIHPASTEVSILKGLLVKRTLLNLCPQREQAVNYMDINPASIPLRHLGFYLGLDGPEGYPDHQAQLSLPPREGSVVHGCDFYSSHVLHADIDSPQGHFIARYNSEIVLTSRSMAL